jgi:hypothetical protein
MKNCRALEHHTTRRIRLIACLTALAGAFTVTLVQPALADRPVPTDIPVPADIQVPAGNRLFLTGDAVGTQDYICLPSGSGFAWSFFGPQATLFNQANRQVITHFLSPNPLESGTPRATWRHSRDTSTVWGQTIASSSDPTFVAPDAIPWLLLQVVGAQGGPTGGHRLTPTTFIQRLNTFGGIAPSTGCTLATDVGKMALVPYSAVYLFYEHRESDTDDDK